MEIGCRGEFIRSHQFQSLQVLDTKNGPKGYFRAYWNWECNDIICLRFFLVQWELWVVEWWGQVHLNVTYENIIGRDMYVQCYGCDLRTKVWRTGTFEWVQPASDSNIPEVVWLEKYKGYNNWMRSIFDIEGESLTVLQSNTRNKCDCTIRCHFDA